MKMKEKRFDKRAFVTCILLLSFIGLPITGFAPHLIAHGGDRTIPHLLMAMHNVLGIIFVITGIIHVGYNYRWIKRGIAGWNGAFPFLSKEPLAAVLIVFAVVAAISGHILLS